MPPNLTFNFRNWPEWLKMLFTLLKALIPALYQLTTNKRCFLAEQQTKIALNTICYLGSRQLCSKSFLLPEIRVSLFSLSWPLLQSFNQQGNEHTKFTSVVIMSFDSLKITCVVLHKIYYHWCEFFFGCFMLITLQLKVTKGNFLKNWAWSPAWMYLAKHQYT